MLFNKYCSLITKELKTGIQMLSIKLKTEIKVLFINTPVYIFIDMNLFLSR